MAVTSSRLDRGSRRRLGQSRYAATWTVVTDDADDGPSTVLVGARSATPDPVPYPGAVYSLKNDLELGSYAKTPTIEHKHRAQHEQHWKVRVEWGPASEVESENPLLEPAKYRLDQVTYTAKVDKDRDGNPIVNKCNQPLEEAIYQKRTHPVLVATKNYQFLDTIVALSATYALKTNSDTYRGQPADSWLCHGITSSEIKSANGWEYYTAHFRLEFNPDTWKEVRLNQGFAHYDTAVNKTLVWEDKNGRFAEPINLKTDGTKEADGATPNSLDFFIQSQVAFSGLPV